MLRFLKREKPRQSTEKSSEAATSQLRINYDSKLIEQLQAEHQALLRLFGEIQTDAELRNIASARKNLQEFRYALRSHLLTKNVKLYAYLSQQLAGDARTSNSVSDFRREMMQIGKTIKLLVAHYGKQTWTVEMEETFLDELIPIGQLLVDRIAREEATLYPLYRSKSGY